MTRCVRAVGAAMFLCSFAASVAAQTPPATLAIIHANLIDGVSNATMNDATVVVVNGKIQSIARGQAAPADATVIDAKGHWLLPGFVDGHTHVGDIDAARRALRSGATTIRTLGVDHFADIGLRELNHAGIADIPDVVAAGYHVRPRPSNAFFLDTPSMADLLGPGVRGADNLRRMVKALADRGVNVIKVMATERAGLPDTTPRVRVFTDEELTAIVDEASRHNLKVAAHAHGDEGANAAVRAGVHTIEHGTWLSEDTLKLMKEKGVYLSPTLTATHDLVEPGGDYDNPVLQIRGRAMWTRAQDMVRRAWRLGVKIIASTDTGYQPRSNERITDEIINLAELGLPPMEAIKAGTSVSAEALGVADRTGAVKVGYEADLVIVDRSPLEDIRNIRDLIVVVNNGRVVLNDFNIAPR